jgi:hypothetical protein
MAVEKRPKNSSEEVIKNVLMKMDKKTKIPLSN